MDFYNLVFWGCGVSLGEFIHSLQYIHSYTHSTKKVYPAISKHSAEYWVTSSKAGSFLQGPAIQKEKAVKLTGAGVIAPGDP